MSEISYEEVRRMADQLSHAERQALILYLLEATEGEELTTEDRMALFDASMISGVFMPDYSDRREDWYGDDGR
jgi:hypothetical protein